MICLCRRFTSSETLIGRNGSSRDRSQSRSTKKIIFMTISDDIRIDIDEDDLKSNDKHTLKHQNNPLRQKFQHIKFLSIRCVVTTLAVLFVMGLAAVFVALWFYVPIYVVDRFASFDSDKTPFPPTQINSFTETQIDMTLAYKYPIENYVDTTIEFEDFMTFSTGGILVANLSLPAINFGPNRRQLLNQTLTFNLLNTTEWVRLYKRWIMRTTTQNLTPQLRAPTYWNISVPIRLRMLGLTWSGIQLTKLIEWNGGLGNGAPIIRLQQEDWSIIPSLKNPGLNLTIAYINSKSVGINFGDFKFAVSVVYRDNSTLSEPVKLLDVRFPQFMYLPGTHNLTFSNQFRIDEPKSLMATTQIVNNFIQNITSIFVFRDFESRADNGKSVSWLNEILESLSFMIQVNRYRPLIDRSQVSKVSDKFGASFDHVTDWSKLQFPTLDNETLSDYFNMNRNSSFRINPGKEQQDGLTNADRAALSKLSNS